MTFKDHFTRTAADYSKYRPHYPEDLFSFLASVCPGRKTVWDCATGSGQAAIGVSRFFDRVIATDASEEQIRNARPRKGVTYCVTLAEQAALKKGTIDLAMAGQAAHWFELDSFYSELRRVLGRGGIIAIWFYSLFRIDPVLDDIIYKLYSEVLGAYWPPERKLIDEQIASLEFPFERLETPVFQMEAFWDLDHLAGYIGTWSAVNRFEEERGFDPMTIIYPELSSAWGEAADSKKLVWPIHMRVGHV